MRVTSKHSVQTVGLVSNTSWYLANFAGDLIAMLQDSGIRVVAFGGRDTSDNRLDMMGCDVVRLPVQPRGLNPVSDLFYAVRLYHAFRQASPHVLLTFTIKPNIYGSLVGALLGIPVVCTISGMGSGMTRGPWLRLILMILQRVAFGVARSIVFLNFHDWSYYTRRRICRKSKSHLFPGPGVDTERFAPLPRIKPRSEIWFLMIGRLLWEKGVQDYIDAASRVQRDHADTRFYMLGFPTDSTKDGLTAAEINGEKLNGVEYLGYTEDVRPYIASADCIVLPTYYAEGLSKTLLEAMSMARPVIATDVPGCRELVEDGRNGFVARPRNADDLARQIVKFLETPEQRRVEFGCTGREIAVKEYDAKIVCSLYLQRIMAVCGPRSRPRKN